MESNESRIIDQKPVQSTGDLAHTGENEKKWIEEAIEREATPRELRKETQEEFCKRHNINPSTYWRNIMRKENKKRIVEIWLNEAIQGGNEVLKALQEKAKSGDTKAIELYIKFVLELSENLDLKSDGQKVIIQQIFYGDKDSNTIQLRSQTISDTSTSRDGSGSEEGNDHLASEIG